MRAATTWPRLTAVILAGGGATRLGGKDKPMLPVAGVPMLDRVLAALAGAGLRIVIGPARAGLPAGVLTTREDPPGAGPAAAAAAAFTLIAPPIEPSAVPVTSFAATGTVLPSPSPSPVLSGGAAVGVALVGLFAADLPYLTAEAVQVLVDAVDGEVDGAVFVDERGRRQLLCGVWRSEALRGGIERLGDPVGKSMRAMLDGLAVAEVRWGWGGPLPYFDCDTVEDLRRADQEPAAMRGERQ